MLAGRYEMRRRLGRGGMATVYEAYDELLDRAMAVKLLDTSRMHRDLKRFGAEARAAAALSHAHVVAVYDVGIQAEWPFIVLELVGARRCNTRSTRVSSSRPATWSR